jgi:hypothetical protein
MRSAIVYCLMFCTVAGVFALGQAAPEVATLLKVPSPLMAARLLTSVTPEALNMPKCSNRMVTLDAVIGKDGTVQTLKVLGGFEGFKESAVTAVKQWTYTPYLQNGSPVAVETTILVFYPSTGKPGSLFVPDGKGGAKGGSFPPMPPECQPPAKPH